MAVAKESLDPYQQIEIDAYSANLQAVFQLEAKDYENALDNLLKAKIIYTKLIQFKDTLEEIIYKEKLTQLDTLIRQCAFSLKGTVIDTSSEDKFINGIVEQYKGKKELE